MTTWPPQPLPLTQRHDTAAIVAVGLVGGTIVLTLMAIALTFAALAVAFPIAVPLAQQFGAYISPRDLEIAERGAEFWWVFAGFAAATLAAAVAAGVAIVRWMLPARSA